MIYFFCCLNLGNLRSQGSLHTNRAMVVPNRESVSQPSANSVSSVESIAQHFLTNPEELAALQRRYPELAEALLSGDHNWMMSAMTQYRRIVAVSFLIMILSFVNVLYTFHINHEY